MTADMIDLARRAVACPKWRWMPGMRTAEGLRIVHDPSRFPDRACALRDGGWTPRLLNPGALPDLTDPATLGCLLALVREAWGDKAVIHIENNNWFYVETDGRHLWDEDNASSLLAALVAALEAAP
jgi:hypothetical protein